MNISLRYFCYWRNIGWFMVLAVIGVSLDPSPPDLSQIEFGDKWAHLASYAGLMFWFAQLYERRVWWKYALGFVGLGIGLEFVQGWTGYRTFDTADMLANTLGVIMGWLSARALPRSLFAIVERHLPVA